MEKETIANAVKVIDRRIKDYQKKLTDQRVLEADAKFGNGNLKSSRDYKSSIIKYEIILADLARIKRAIENDQKNVKIFQTAERKYSAYYAETKEALYEAGFYGVKTASGELALYPIDEMDD